jgi:hypothetical protein
MGVQQYYNNVKLLSERVKAQDLSLHEGLNIGPDEDHPSEWMPRVQNLLLSYYRKNSSALEGDQALRLYIEGQIILNARPHHTAVKTGLICMVVGVILGWIIWGHKDEKDFNCQLCEPNRVFFEYKQNKI